MKSLLRLVSLLLLLLLLTTGLTVSYDHGDDVCMVCTCSSLECSLNPDICCYQLDTSPLDRLTVDVNCSQPDHARIIDPGQSASGRVHDPSACHGFHLLHQNGCLTELPVGYCQYVNTMAISMSNNSLSNFPDWKCLPQLRRLDLRHNKLTYVPLGAFRGLTYIRDIFLDYNEIDYIHPDAFEGPTQLIRFSVSHNRLLVFEPWILYLHYPFCYFSVSHNLVHEFTNHGHRKINMSLAVVYGPGFVDFTYNRIEVRPTRKTFEKYGITTIQQLAKFIHWGFDFRHNPLICDCNMYELVKWAKALANIIWRDYFNITCGNPPELRGFPSLELPLTDFVCKIQVNCPPRCYCNDQPATKAVNIFCNNVGLQSLPGVLPEGNHLVIHMANNSLNTLPPRQYLARTKRIDLRGSGLRVIKKDTPNLLRKVKWVDLRDNELHNLPSTFQVLDSGVVHLDLHTLRCSCDLHWMTAWLRHTVNHGLTNITCTKEGKHILLIEATQHDLCGEKPAPHHTTTYKVSLIVILATLTVIVSVLVFFRYEAQMLVYRFRQQYTQHQQKENVALLNTPQFDVFISMNNDSDSDAEWVNNVLVPRLDQRGLSSYFPLRDCRVGSVEMDELTKRTHDSGAVVVVLSPDFVQSPSCLSQFRSAYNHMMSRVQGRLLIIKRGGHLSRTSVREPRLRAMLTLRMFYTSDPEQLDKALDILNVDQENDL
ncbi:hypothetical protein ACOMHN_044046 [Nucella lapillus]